MTTTQRAIAKRIATEGPTRRWEVTTAQHTYDIVAERAERSSRSVVFVRRHGQTTEQRFEAFDALRDALLRIDRLEAEEAGRTFWAARCHCWRHAAGRCPQRDIWTTPDRRGVCDACWGGCNHGSEQA